MNPEDFISNNKSKAKPKFNEMGPYVFRYKIYIIYCGFY